MDAAPVRLVLTDDLQRSRLTVFFRLLLALPHIVWIVLWTFAVVVASIVAWVATLVSGRPPETLHRFFSAYTHYNVQLSGYISLTANPYPSFTGGPGYPVDVELPERAQQSRWKTAFRFPLALPALLVAAVVGAGSLGGGGGSSGRRAGEPDYWEFAFSGGGLVAVCAFLGWFAILARGRMPNGLRDLAAYGIGYTAQLYAYLLFLTDRYPNANPEAVGPAWSLRPHAIELRLDDDSRRSRLTVFFRFLLALPHLVWLLLWSVAAFVAAVVNGIVALVRGRSAEPLHRFLAAYVRYAAHVTAFLSLVANPFPGFVGEPGYPVDVTIAGAERQNRWVTLFRSFLVLPAFVVAAGLSGALVLVGILGWFAALATGRMPEGLRNLGAVAVRYLAQTNAYWLIVTDDYPYASPALTAPRGEEQVELEHWEAA
jgi:hypothetical protein